MSKRDKSSNLEFCLTDIDVPLSRVPLKYSVKSLFFRAGYELKRFVKKNYFSNCFVYMF